MNEDWDGWSENKDCAALHGVTPGFADVIAAQSASRFDNAVLNVRPDPIDLRDRYYQASLAALTTRLRPPDLDVAGISIREQGDEGSCTGQALAAVIDLQNAARRAARGAEDQDIAIPAQVSARMLYEMARLHDEYSDDGLPGSSVRGAIKGFFHNGVCDDQSAPYVAGETAWTMSAEIGKEARCTGLGAYYRLRHILNDYHAALGEVGALLCSAMIHDGWRQDAVRAENGHIRMPAAAGPIDLVGAHAFAIVGYDRDGFYVLNSWGQEWGGFESGDGGDGTRRAAGIAHWSYDDWQNHVLDTWVVRLSAPFPGAFGMTGGYIRPQARLAAPGDIETTAVQRPEPAVSRQQIIGHYIHIDDGRLVTAGPYPSGLPTIRETADYLRNMDQEGDAAKRYDRVAFFVHGGLNDLKESVARTAALAPAFKRNGVYPIFILWRTGLLETWGDVLAGFGRRLFMRTGGAEDVTNRLLEEAMQRVGRPAWDDMKGDAERGFTIAPGGGWDAVGTILAALAARTSHPASVHFIGHSAGAILLGRLFSRMQGQPAPAIGSVSLMAPACTLPFFMEHIDPLAEGGAAAARLATFILSDAAERRDRVAVYRRSLLYLISNGLEGRRGVPVAGMETFWPGRPGWTTVLAGPSSEASRSETHGGFDNDPRTMNTILSTICGRPLAEANGGFTLAELNF